MKEVAIRILSAPIGRTHLFFLGQAGFVLKSSKGTTLGIDLYLTDCVERYDGFKRLMPHLLLPQEVEFDYLVATHAHYDHFDVDAVPLMLANPKTRMFASMRCAQEAERLHLEPSKLDYVCVGDRRVAGDIRLSFIFCDHGESAPDALGLMIEIDGKILYIAGDTCLRLDKVDGILAGRKIDVMIAPINGAFGNLNEAEAVALCRTIKPRLMIPCHYWNFAEHHGDPGLFMQLIQEQFPGQRYVLMPPGERIDL